MTMAFVVQDRNGGTTVWDRARKDARWPGIIMAVVTTLILVATVVLPDGGRSFAFCEAIGSAESGPCEFNFVNLIVLGALATAVLVPLWIIVVAALIVSVRRFIGESLPPLAQPRAMVETIAKVTGAQVVETEGGIVPAAPRKRSARLRRARIDVVRQVMTMLGMSRAAILAKDEAERSAAFAAAEQNGATQTDIDWSETATGSSDKAETASEAIVARVEATAGEGARDFLPPRIVEGDTNQSEPPASAASSAFVAPVVATVDGGLIDLNRRINGTLATRTANVVVLADVRAQREGGDPAALAADSAGQGTPLPSTAEPASTAPLADADPDRSVDIGEPVAVEAIEAVAVATVAPSVEAAADAPAGPVAIEAIGEAVVADEALAAEVARVVEAEPPHATVDEPVDVEVQAFRDLIDGIDNPGQYLQPVERPFALVAKAVVAVEPADVVSLEDAASGYLQRRPAREAEVAAS